MEIIVDSDSEQNISGKGNESRTIKKKKKKS